MIGERRVLRVLNLPLSCDANQLDLGFHADLEKDMHLMPPDGLHGHLSRPSNVLDALPLDQSV